MQSHKFGRPVKAAFDFLCIINAFCLFKEIYLKAFLRRRCLSQLLLHFSFYQSTARYFGFNQFEKVESYLTTFPCKSLFLNTIDSQVSNLFADCLSASSIKISPAFGQGRKTNL